MAAKKRTTSKLRMPAKWTIARWLGFLSGVGGFGYYKGTAPAPSPTYSTVAVDQRADGETGPWAKEVTRRFPTALVVYSHGSDVDGEWWITPDHGPALPAQRFADGLRVQWPGRIIVLVACNPGKRDITTPGVYYAKGNVLGVPDKALNIGAKMYPDAVGNVFEFTGHPLN